MYLVFMNFCVKLIVSKNMKTYPFHTSIKSQYMPFLGIKYKQNETNMAENVTYFIILCFLLKLINLALPYHLLNMYVYPCKNKPSTKITLTGYKILMVRVIKSTHFTHL